MNFSSEKTLILSSQDVQKIMIEYTPNVIMKTLIDDLISVIQTYSSKKTIIPPRFGFNYETPNTGLVEWMPLYDVNKNVTIKVVGYHPSNPIIHNLPTILSTITAYDTASGHLLGIVDGVLLTALRTGAASAIASKYLAHPDSKTLGLIGCGAQSITQLHALSMFFDFDKVLIFDTDVQSMFSFEDRGQALNLKSHIQISNIEEIVKSSDIICTATSIGVGEGPLFDGIETLPHVHINAVGSDFPSKTELPLSLLNKSFICPDFKAQALVEGECQQLSENDINATLTEVVQNPIQFSNIQNQRSVFDSTGWALEDRVIFELFMNWANELNLGRLIEIEQVSNDVKNPYHFLNKNITLVSK